MSTMTLTIERTLRTLMINGQAVIVEELGGACPLPASQSISMRSAVMARSRSS